MKRMPFELAVGILIVGIIALTAAAGALVFAIADRDLAGPPTATPLPIVKPPETLVAPAAVPTLPEPTQPSAFAVPSAPASMVPPAGPATSTPPPDGPLNAPATQATPLLPANHPTYPATQPCESCHDPHGG